MTFAGFGGLLSDSAGAAAFVTCGVGVATTTSTEEAAGTVVGGDVVATGVVSAGGAGSVEAVFAGWLDGGKAVGVSGMRC